MFKPRLDIPSSATNAKQEKDLALSASAQSQRNFRTLPLWSNVIVNVVRLSVSRAKEVKVVFLSVFLFSLNILSFTENGSFYGCGRDDGTSFEEFRDNWERFFDEQPEMNGRCVRAARPIPDTYCFCDTDGCNAP